MKIKNSLKNTLVIIICYLYVLLFVYAAVSKLLDFNTFQVQLGQSPLLSAFAGWVSWAVVLSELLIAGLLFLSVCSFWIIGSIVDSGECITKFY